MRLVDDQDLVAVAHRGVGDHLQQLARLSTLVRDAASTSSTSMRPALGDLLAGVALSAGGRRRPLLAVEALGQDARDRRLSGAAQSGEDVGVGQPVALDRVGQRRATCGCPTSSSKFWGRHLRARTWYIVNSPAPTSGSGASDGAQVTCGTCDDSLTVAPFRAWRDSRDRSAQGLGPAISRRRTLRDRIAASRPSRPFSTAGWRREWDSNPRYVAAHTLSKRAP